MKDVQQRTDDSKLHSMFDLSTSNFYHTNFSTAWFIPARYIIAGETDQSRAPKMALMHALDGRESSRSQRRIRGPGYSSERTGRTERRSGWAGMQADGWEHRAGIMGHLRSTAHLLVGATAPGDGEEDLGRAVRLGVSVQKGGRRRRPPTALVRPPAVVAVAGASKEARPCLIGF